MRARILIIDDDSAFQAFMKYVLGSAGHEVTAVGDGEAGLKAAQDSPPDLVISDAQIPKLNGCELAQRLKGDEKLRAIPLLAVTALAMAADRERILAAGFDGYIAKPIVPETFVNQIEAFLPKELRSGGLCSSSTKTESCPPDVIADRPAAVPSDARSRMIREMSRSFVQNVSTLLASIRGASAQKDMKALRAAAHKTLGACIFLKEPQLVESLRRLEKMIDNKDLENINSTLRDVEARAISVKSRLQPAVDADPAESSVDVARSVGASR